MAEGSKFAKSLRSPWQWVGVSVILGVIGAIVFWPINGGIESRPSPLLQGARSINLLMYSYAQDHNGKYPAGKSSTEVFQKLIDEKYVDNPTVFYHEMRGKIEPASSQLKPENVSWDITVPVDDHDSDYLPTVFLTGYKIQYVSAGSAIPLQASRVKYPGIAICYKSMSATFVRDDGLSDHIVPNVISKDFDPAGKKYQQLTPDGPLDR